jgi:hypothetical protein
MKQAANPSIERTSREKPREATHFKRCAVAGEHGLSRRFAMDAGQTRDWIVERITR